MNGDALTQRVIALERQEAESRQAERELARDFGGLRERVVTMEAELVHVRSDINGATARIEAALHAETEARRAAAAEATARHDRAEQRRDAELERRKRNVTWLAGVIGGAAVAGSIVAELVR